MKKLREAQGRPAAVGPVAQVSVNERAALRGESSASASGASSSRTIEFDLDAIRAAGLYAKQNRALADQYRVIKRPLLAKAADASTAEPTNLIAVTSALAGEGKTFTAINLALSLTTEKDWRVLLIDADCKNPELSRLLGAENELGLLDLLKDGTAHVGSMIVSTSIPGLSVMPLGSADEHAAELLASERMTGICADLAAVPRQLVIFDTSPLLLTTEAAVVCTRTGQVVVVVRSGKTPQHAVLGAIHKLDESKTVGLVLNCASDPRDALHYGAYGAYPYAARDNQGAYEI